MIKSMLTLLRRTQSFDDRMRKIEENRQTQPINEENNEENVMPFQTDEQLLEFEKKLKNPIFFQKMVSYKVKIYYYL